MPSLPGYLDKAPGQSSCVPPSVQEQGPRDLSWRFLALLFPVQAHSLSLPQWTKARCWI